MSRTGGVDTRILSSFGGHRNTSPGPPEAKTGPRSTHAEQDNQPVSVSEKGIGRFQADKFAISEPLLSVVILQTGGP